MAYPNLRAEMARKGITQIEIADFLGITAGLLRKKFEGSVKFPIEEAARIQEKFFPAHGIKYLFADEPEAPTT